MKPEYPIFFAKASTAIALPIIFITTIFYITNAIYLPAKDIYPMAITFFGITAALSGICFTMAPVKTEELSIRYAGEKFLHSSLLLMQTVIIVFAKESLSSLPFMNTHFTVKIIIVSVLGGILSLISSIAAITWFWGFQELNKDLWKKWKERIENMRNSSKKT